MNPKPECPHHEGVDRDIREIERVQRSRPCGEHEVRLKTLEKSDEEQWTAINQVRASVWYGRGFVAAAAMIGSGLGAAAVTYFMRG